MTNPAAERRRVAVREPEEEPGPRRGCILFGAVLGVIAGAIAAFFVIPPLLNHYFGEANVRAGTTYTGDAKEVRVVSVEHTAADGQPFPGQFEVRLELTTNKTWSPRPEDFELDRGTGEERVAALPPDAQRAETSLTFALGERRTLLLRFPGTQRVDARPVALYFHDPRVRFELGGLR